MTDVVRITNCLVLFVNILSTSAFGSLQVCSDRANLAFNKPASQSSTFIARDKPAGAERAVDGNLNAAFYGCTSCTHTHGEDNPWWMVDLLQEYYIHRVEITSRVEEGQRFKDVDIETSRSYNSTTGLVHPSLCVHLVSQAPGSTVTYDCQSVVLTRYVKVTIMGFGILSLCEVRVFGEQNESFSEASTPCRKQYSVFGRDRIPAVPPILSEIFKSKTTCAQKCGTTSGCLAFAVTNLGTFDWACRLFDCNAGIDMAKPNTTYFIQSL